MSEEVLNNDVTKTESPTEPAATVENKEAEQVSNYIAPSEEEYKKAIQSASSKAKYAILQELGIKSVDEFKAKTAEYDNAIKERDALKEDKLKIESQVDKLKVELALEQLGVGDEYKEDLITLAKAKVSDKVDFKSAAEEVLNKNPNWKKNNSPLKLGTEKTEVKPTTVEDRLSKKYAWLK